MSGGRDSGRVALHPFGLPLPYVRAATGVLDELDGIRWRERGLCAGDTTGGWFDDTRTPAARRARAVCGSCPVQRRCLAAALLYGEEYGIWGGLDPDQRQDLDHRLHEGTPLGSVVDAVLRPDQVA